MLQHMKETENERNAKVCGEHTQKRRAYVRVCADSIASYLYLRSSCAVRMGDIGKEIPRYWAMT